jgi:endogenous inhibitor of DNA gyrase (YacG/DUF329 family)
MGAYCLKPNSGQTRMTNALPPANDNSSAKSAPVCAICGRPRAEKYSPFCSRRCADVDLYRWLNGKYAIQASDEPDEESRDVRDEDE